MTTATKITGADLRDAAGQANEAKSHIYAAREAVANVVLLIDTHSKRNTLDPRQGGVESLAYLCDQQTAAVAAVDAAVDALNAAIEAYRDALRLEEA